MNENMTVTEKVAYLKGLMEGMQLDTTTNEGKILAAVVDILADMADDLEDVASDLYDLGEDVDAISDDLSDVEDYLCDDDWDDEDDDYDEDEEDDDEEPLFFEVTRPACEKTITVDEDVLNLGTIQCPNCGEMMEFEFDEDDEEDED